MPTTDMSVLVVGAGPTGLVVGTELVRRGVNVRLIDKLHGPVSTSRAFTVHSRTLEAFDVMGIGATVEKMGVIARSMVYHFIGPVEKGLQDLRLDFSSLVVRGRHPYIVTMPQTVLEAVLRNAFESAGGVIEWGVELMDFIEKDGAEGVLAKMGGCAGSEDTVFSYVVACDGARSSVRKGLNIAFSGLQYSGMSLKMMDVSLHGTFPASLYSHEEYHYFIKEESMVLLAKMGSAEEYGGQRDVWRVLVSTKEETPDVSVEAFQSAVDHVLDGVKLGAPIWTVDYRVQKRIVSSYRSENGRVLLAGDAAHINSPAGGQGMNTAIQDGFNLGWKLALVCHGFANSKTLDSYQRERQPIARMVLEGTDLLHSVIMAHGKGLIERMQVARNEQWAEKAVNRMSGQAFRYSLTPGGDETNSFGNRILVKDGDQAPDVLVQVQHSSLVERLTSVQAPYFVLVLFEPELADNVISELGAKWSKILEIARYAHDGTEQEEGSSTSPTPSNAQLRAQYGTCAAVLLRPDRYIERIISDHTRVKVEVERTFRLL